MGGGTVASNDWYKEAVEYVYQNGIMVGYRRAAFLPQRGF